MSFEIAKLDRNLLIRIEPLLSASVGYQTSIHDELDFFDSTLPKGWILAFDENQKSQTFFYYELKIEAKNSVHEFHRDGVSASDVVEAFANLHPVNLDEVEGWMKGESIRTISFEGKVTAAAQIFNYGKSAEINRIATNSKFLRRGFAKLLMQSICDELSEKGVERLFLKVEDVRKPAIQFYESFGFVKNEEKTQAWLSKYF